MADVVAQAILTVYKPAVVLTSAPNYMPVTLSQRIAHMPGTYVPA